MQWNQKWETLHTKLLNTHLTLKPDGELYYFYSSNCKANLDVHSLEQLKSDIDHLIELVESAPNKG